MNTLIVHGVTTGSITGYITHWLLHFHGGLAYTLVGVLVFAEAALFVGFFLPGETAAVVGGVLAGAGSVNLEAMMTVVVLSAIVGDSVGYVVGRTAGPWLLDRRPLRGSSAVHRTKTYWSAGVDRRYSSGGSSPSPVLSFPDSPA